ncbi:LysR family transcriptional regulator [Yersinia vastinensis]|uniref:LysR family transcriptional regulator n=1 Tax=Yersinia vastinensis TaxID=2890318 RepID=UPI00119CE3C3|nr:LysR family transcriptional regulator [Yersinia vastinensis]
MDRLQSMAVFIKVVDCGSFARASEHLDISSQMVGKHVAFLEDRLGTQLLNRTTRKQSLTEIGALFYERCKVVLAEAEAAESIAHELNATPRGRLRINAPVTFGAYSLAPMMTRYLHEYPEVHVDLTLNDRFVDLIDEGYEAVIRLGALKDSSLIARSLAPYRLIACASPDYLLEHGIPKVPADLTTHECLGYTYWTHPPERGWHFTKDGQVHVIQVNGRLQVNDATALLCAALHNGGIILGAEVVLKNYLNSGQLVQVLADYQAPSRQMHILFAANRRPTPKLRSFIDFVVAEFGQPD